MSIESIGIVDLTSMVEYWEEMTINSKRALDYANSQREYWLGKLIVAQESEA